MEYLYKDFHPNWDFPSIYSIGFLWLLMFNSSASYLKSIRFPEQSSLGVRILSQPTGAQRARGSLRGQNPLAAKYLQYIQYFLRKQRIYLNMFI